MTYTPRQTQIIVEHVLKQLNIPISFDEDHDERQFFDNMNGLFLKLYQMEIRQQQISITKARRYIPLRNLSVQKKYLLKAQQRGFLTLVHDTQDRRRQWVMPTEALRQHVEQLLTRMLDNERTLVGRLAQVDPLPDDGKALAGLHLP